MSTEAHVISSGFGKHLGLTLEEVTGDVVRGTIALSPDHHQAYGIVHGGVYCAVVEHVASIAAATWFAGRGNVVGVSNSTHFVRAARTGLLQVETTPLQRGRTQQLWQVFITDDQRRLIAKGEVRLANIPDSGVLGE